MPALANDKRRASLHGIVILLVFIALLGRAFLGFDITDEPYYLATAYDRVAKGFNMTGAYSIHQTSVFLTAPFVLLYGQLFGSLQGVMLCIRIAYAAITAMTAYMIYGTLKKNGTGDGAALMIALLYAFFCPLAIPTFSYNTLLLICLSLSLCALFSAEKTGRFSIVSGMCMVFSVFAYPPVILCLPAYAAIAWCAGKQHIRAKKNLMFIAVGMALAAFMFALSYIGTPLGALTDIWQNMFKDPEHQGISLMEKLRTYVSGFLKTNGLPALILNSVLFLIAAFVRLVKDEKKKNTLIHVVLFGILIAAALSLLHLVRLPKDGTIKINLFMHLFTFAFPIMWMATAQKSRSILLLWLLGLVVSVAVHIGTNNGFIVSAYPLMYSSAASILYAEKAFKAYKKWQNSFLVMAAMCLVLPIGYFRLASVYRDAPLPALNTRIETGVAKGLYTTRERAKQYHSLQRDLSAYKDQLRGKKILVSTLLPWVYPEMGAGLAAPNAWRTPLNSERLIRYYARYPQFIPDAILVVKDGTENTPGGFFTKERLDTYYYSNELEYGTLYIRNDTAMEGL